MKKFVTVGNSCKLALYIGRAVSFVDTVVLAGFLDSSNPTTIGVSEILGFLVSILLETNTFKIQIQAKSNEIQVPLESNGLGFRLDSGFRT